MFKNFKTNPPEAGTRILAFAPVYPKGDPMRFRILAVLPCAMEDIVAYVGVEDLELEVMVDGMFDAA